MLDFTGYTCVNCRKMEENVWTDERIDRYLRDEYVIVSLYVDDRSELPTAEHLDGRPPGRHRAYPPHRSGR